MARYGEGDKRWIVEERPDGTNVHNWHWAETNCLEWSRTFFTNLLSNLSILQGEGEAKDSNGNSLLKVDGTVEIPYISDENADEDPEVRVTVNDEGPVGKTIKDAMISKGKPLILDKVRVWVQSMAKGGPVKDELDTKKPTLVQAPAQQNHVPTTSPATVAPAAPLKKENKKGGKSISMTERFNCRAKDLYEILLDENRWKGFTQSNARISKEVGGDFSIFDGSVTGTNLELQEAKLIVQRWRFGSWNDGVQSTVRLVFEEPESGVTVVKLTHSDVPEEDRYGNATVVENTERGWRDLIFQRIRAVFGFGI
ncbi:activator of 90 kDa heat shock protein ATPase homolog isoform X3 [Abrus precatorius]|uniref:Activator of 90 kDa heat shock protein ATPase homolog isoform X3 n=1 Tax=Abrus precatorius TaxID=3816 RepID=A0A8B8L6L4_ABRPR|nr:activator of 90 kDa heat shock protein ATPase homolog isoform X3 [Abrus precatorius]